MQIRNHLTWSSSFLPLTTLLLNQDLFLSFCMFVAFRIVLYQPRNRSTYKSLRLKLLQPIFWWWWWWCGLYPISEWCFLFKAFRSLVLTFKINRFSPYPPWYTTYQQKYCTFPFFSSDLVGNNADEIAISSIYPLLL